MKHHSFRHRICYHTLLLGIAALLPLAALAEKAERLKALGRLPVKEITVFKDGHAFIEQEGMVSTDGQGNVALDQLPNPVIGTFWPYAADSKTKLTGVVAGQRRVLVDRTALNLRELLEANIGAEAIITESATNRYTATIVDVPRRSSEELAATAAPNTSERLPEAGTLILLKNADGVKAIPLDRIQDVTIKDFRPTATTEEFRNLLTLKLDWGKARPAAAANVGLLYLQKGIRWIPSYKITIDGNSNAVVSLQATLINELMDLEDANVNLVVGVPTFAFKDTLDPIAIQQTAAQLSQFFRNDMNGVGYNGQFAGNFANSIMSQQAYAPNVNRAPAEAGPAAPEMADGTQNEDLFVFNAGHLSMKKGERMVISLAEYTLNYKDVFTLDLPFAPPPEIRQSLNQQSVEMARLMSSPKVMHKIRLTNKSRYPLTTAPALVLRDGRVLSQGMMTFAATGATCDLTVTTAVDVSVKKSDKETRRVQNAININGSEFTRIDLAGEVSVTNFRGQPTEIEVTRFVLGNAESAEHDGTVEKINALEDSDYSTMQMSWGNWNGWNSWWSYVNGIGRITWKLNLKPGECGELKYKWNYYWR